MTRFSRVACLFLALLFTPGLRPPMAEQGPPRPRIVDTKLDEEERIRQRLEWFYSSRRAGASSDVEMAGVSIN